ncbi:helix-turn-helix transcriptional regulator [uncultured Meiothermus sp.]|uniref:helix-turn-helix domain-containing protein n=1 Tax=uncultured Meiothermus sp. TaxID=157471 RepID=UPI003456EC28
MGVKRPTDTLAERIRTALLERGLTQADLAREAHLSTGHVAMLLGGKRGQRGLTVRTAARLSRALHKPISYFLPAETHSEE